MTAINASHVAVNVKPNLTSILASAVLLPVTWAKRVRDRRQLLQLLGESDHMTKDIGIARADIVRESMKPFWVA
jgi:uncharacterized protein YjiS (DUF1127 family)